MHTTVVKGFLTTVLGLVLMGSPTLALADVYDDLRRNRDKVSDSVGVGAGVGCAAVAAAFAFNPLGIFTGPIAGLICATILASATETAINCTTDRQVLKRMGQTGSCASIRVPIFGSRF